jgi:hypothetical protein
LLLVVLVIHLHRFILMFCVMCDVRICE